MFIFLILLSASVLVATSNFSQRYIVLAPKIVRPDSTYKVAVILFDSEFTYLNLRATITRNNEQIAANNVDVVITGSSIKTIPLQIPVSIRNGKFELKIEGGDVGAPVFTNVTELHFSPLFLSITVQTSRPIYRAGQQVLFRVLILHTDLRPFDDAVEIHILDPDGFIMKRWLSAYTNNGVASLAFKLPEMTKDGFWKIHVKAWDQVEEKLIRVETYFSPYFEIHIKWPAYILSNEDMITAYISGLFTSEEIARGNATFHLSGRSFSSLSNSSTNETYTDIWFDKTFIKNKDYKLELPMNYVKAAMGYLDGVELRLDVSITEFLFGETVSGFSLTRIIPSELNVRFSSLTPAVFRPGIPFLTQIIVSYQDNEKIPEEILAGSQLQIQATLYSDSGGEKILPTVIAGLDDNSEKIKYKFDQNKEEKEIFFSSLQNENYLQEGILSLKFDTETDINKIIVSALFTCCDGIRIESQIEAVRHFSEHKKYIGVYTSTSDAVVGEYAVFHVKSNFIMDSFQYLVMSKSQILLSGEKKTLSSMGLSVATIAIPLAPEMAPGFQLIVLHRTLNSEIVTDSFYLPVDGFSRYEMEVELNTGKDLKAERVEIRASGEEGAFIGVNAIRSTGFQIQAGNEMTKSRVIDSLINFEAIKRYLHKVKWKSRNGFYADESIYLPSADYGRDANETFILAGLTSLTTENIPINPSKLLCGETNQLACVSGSCFGVEEKCNGYQDCDDGTDEINCPSTDDSDDYYYKISRFSRSTFLFDADDGDWGWREIKKNDHDGIEFEPLWPPQVADDWYFTGFSVGKDTGFTIISEPVLFSYKRPFTMHVSGPSFCHRGEQLGLRLILVNNHNLQALVLVELVGSPDYKFIHVKEGGIVTSYNPRLSSGDHQILVYLAPESQEHIDFPVAPTIEQGDIAIKFVASTQTALSKATHKIKVIAEGALITRHTSEFLDLKNRALSLHYLNIIVEESPIVSYQEWRRYVYGSPSATLTLTGDMIGPTFPEIPVTLKSLLNRYGKGTESVLFEMAANVWTLHYLRLTNQLKPVTLNAVLNEINTFYAHIMKRYNSNGWFYNWNPRKPSVWLTAWALRIFKHATFPDWENILFIDPDIFSRSTSWLLKFQAFTGCFREYPLASYIDSKFVVNNTDVPLTAHVLITLSELVAGGVIGGNIRSEAISGIHNAVFYLEHQLSMLTDPHHITISTYALTLANSYEKELAFVIMQRICRHNNEGLVYWSREVLPSNPIKIENQRPFKQPRFYHESDSVAVESTSWALLVNLQRDGVTEFAEKIVQWLTTIRMTCSGFISSVDTVIALQALTEYAFRTRLLDITNISVTVDMAIADFKKRIHIGNSSFAQPSVLELPTVWGFINVVGRGAGQALAQLDVNYGIDYEELKDKPSVPSFNLKIKEFYSYYRNKSSITIESCLRWVRSWPAVSGSAVLEIETPTGYHLTESAAEELVKNINHPSLYDAKTIEGKTLWFFEYVEQTWSCFNHTVRRWYPVANLTLYRQALLYEITARERFEQVLVNSTPLYILNICEVCGSYQCPYCPFYNKANHQISSLYSVMVLFSFIYTKCYYRCIYLHK